VRVGDVEGHRFQSQRHPCTLDRARARGDRLRAKIDYLAAGSPGGGVVLTYV